MKIIVGQILSPLVIALGLVGVFLESLQRLPPPFDYPWVSPLVAVVGFVLLALGWQEKFNEGKSSIIDLVRKFLDSDQYWKLGITLLLVALKAISALALPAGLAVTVQSLLAVLATFGYVFANASFTAKHKLFVMNSRLGTLQRNAVDWETL